MPKIAPLTADAQMDQQLLASIDKYMRLANIFYYGDLGPYIGCSARTARNRIQKPGAFTLTELRRIARVLKIPPDEFLAGIYDKK